MIEEPVAVVTDAAFTDAVAQLRAVASRYHLAHGLLDHADHLAATGRAATAERDEAALIAQHLRAADLADRLACLGDRDAALPRESG